MARYLAPAIRFSGQSCVVAMTLVASITFAAQRPCTDIDQTHLCFRLSPTTQVNDDPSGNRASIANINAPQPGKSSTPNRTTLLAPIQIQYEGGTDNERHARVVDDPSEPGTKVLMFALNSPNVRAANGRAQKGRIQANMYGNKNVRELRETVSLRLDEGFRILREYPDAFDWMTISEWWNNAAWSGAKFPFRISVNIVKTQRGRGVPLRLAAHGQTFDPVGKRWHTVWEKINSTFEVTSERWLALDYRYIQGGTQDGRFFLSVTPEGERTITIFDITNATHHPADLSPDGLGHLNPMKLYTSRQTIEFVRDRGSALRVYWRDLDVRACAGDKQDSAGDVSDDNWLPCGGR